MKKSMDKKVAFRKITAATLAGILLVGGIPLSNEAFAKTKLKVSTKKINLNVGKQKVLQANQKVTFATTNKKIAVVTKKKKKQCVVKAVNAGSCKIVVKNKKSTIKVSVKVTKKENPTESTIGIAKPEVLVTAIPGTVQQATATPIVTPTAKVENSAAPTETVTQTPEQTSPEKSPMTIATQTPAGHTEEPKETENVATKTPFEGDNIEPTVTPNVVTNPAVVTEPATVTEAAGSTGAATVTEESIKAETIQQSVNRLGFRLFDELADNKNGKVISPYSVTNAMAMLINGADGESYKELQNALGIDDFAKWNKEYSEYVKEHANIEDTNEYSEYRKNEKQPTLKVNNSFWYNDTNYTFDSTEQKAYMKTIEDLYNAEANQMDFKNTNPKDQINQWIEDKTDDMIKNMIQDEIKEDTSTMLVNTVFFDARWKECFSLLRNVEMNFYGVKETNKVTMMRSEDRSSYKYYTNDSLQMLSIPFRDDENGFEMDIIMQADEDKENAVEQWKNLSSDKKEALFAALEDAKAPEYGVNLTLPKFSMEYGTVELRGALEKMGIKNCFDKALAEFPAIRGNNKDNFYVDSVLHKTKIEVEETGVTAAAASVVEIKAGCVAGVPDPIEFTVDHPFVFAIRDKSGMIYFMGQITDLEASK